MDPCDPHAASSLVSQDEMRPVQAADKLRQAADTLQAADKLDAKC